MTKTLTQHLQAIKASKQGLFIPYIMVGDHEKGLEGLSETISYLAEAGVPAIELGLPFSDPVADGPIIEAAGQRSLAKGVTLAKLIGYLQTLDSQVPLIIMTYLNPIYRYGFQRLVNDLATTSVKGLIVPDLPHEHKEMLDSHLEASDLVLIPLVSLTTGLARQRELVKDAEGFVYAVAINGVTGKTRAYRDDLDQHLSRLRDLASVPVLTGFGVASKEDIDRFNQVSDGVIVGSKIVQDLHEGKEDDLRDLISYGSHYQKA